MLVSHFFFINVCWLIQITFLTFRCVEMVSRIICSITFPGIEVRLQMMQNKIKQ